MKGENDERFHGPQYVYGENHGQTQQQGRDSVEEPRQPEIYHPRSVVSIVVRVFSTMFNVPLASPTGVDRPREPADIAVLLLHLVVRDQKQGFLRRLPASESKATRMHGAQGTHVMILIGGRSRDKHTGGRLKVFFLELWGDHLLAPSDCRYKFTGSSQTGKTPAPGCMYAHRVQPLSKICGRLFAAVVERTCAAP